MKKFVTRSRCPFAVLLGGLWFGTLGLSVSEDWKSALSSAESGTSLWGRAEKSRELSGLTKAIVGLEGKGLEQHAAFAVRFLPGGDLASEVSTEDQAKLLGAWSQAAPSPSKAYRIWRIHQLTPDETIKGAALAALQALPEDLLPAMAVADLKAASGGEIDPKKMERGKAVYMRVGICVTCHQANGEGIPGAFPPLAGSEWFDDDSERQIKIVLKGLMGELEVKGQPFNSVMAPLGGLLKDDEIADVLTYVSNEWGNTGPEFTVEEVKAVRDKTKDQAIPYQAADLLKEHPLRK